MEGSPARPTEAQPIEAAAPPRTGGLGRGLDAIIPIPPSAPQRSNQDSTPAVTRVDQVFSDLVEAGLDALQASIDGLDLCAYLHAADGQGPQLHLRQPTMATLTATEAFELFAALGALLERGGTDGPAVIGRFHGLGIGTTSGRGTSKGLHAVGRLDLPLDDAEQATATRLCQAIGAACHHLDGGARPDDDEPPFPTRVVVQMTEGLASAEVTLATAGELRTTRAEGTTALNAVANAVTRAMGERAAVGEVQQLTVAGRNAVAVLALAPDGRAGLGSALAEPDDLHAAASATLAALAAAERRPAP